MNGNLDNIVFASLRISISFNSILYSKVDENVNISGFMLCYIDEIQSCSNIIIKGRSSAEALHSQWNFTYTFAIFLTGSLAMMEHDVYLTKFLRAWVSRRIFTTIGLGLRMSTIFITINHINFTPQSFRKECVQRTRSN